MHKFLDVYKLNQKEMKNLNRPLIINEIKTIIKCLPFRKVQDLMTLLLNSIKF
jgi:hypothetical protein